MNSETLIKLLPLIGIALGLLIGEGSRSGLLANLSWGELIEALSSNMSIDRNIAKSDLTRLGTYGLAGGVLGFLLSNFLKNQNAKDKK